MIHGGMTSEDRRVAIDAFVNGSSNLLLATDAAGEGLNLHRGCRVVINLELPWNPMRLEQRIGRVDRIGQTRRVHVFHLIARDTGEMHVLERLKARLTRADASLGAPDPLGRFESADDEPLARLIVGGQSDTDIAGATVRADQDSRATVALTRLTTEAAAEHERLCAVRAVANARDRRLPALSGDVMIAFSRRSALRSKLSSRTLAVVAAALADDVGRAIALHLTPLLLDTSFTFARGDRSGRHAFLNALRSLDLERLDPALPVWRAESGRAHVAFWDAWLSRERSIAAQICEPETSLLQSGLFDHRAGRQRLLDIGYQQRLSDEAATRIAAAEHARTMHFESRRAVLLVTCTYGARRG